jgi:hypothetical protein
MTSGNKNKSGYFDLAVMLALAGLSFFGASAYVILPVGAVLLTASTLQEYAYLQPRFVRAGAMGLMVGGTLLAALTSLAFTALCFAIGRFFAWLIAA